MNPVNTPNLAQKKQFLTIFWLVFLINTISFPFVGFMVTQNRGFDPSLNSNLGGALMLAIGLVLFVISHLIFNKISKKPIHINEYQAPFIISCVFVDAISILGLWHISTANLDKFAYTLFGLGLLGIIMKKPNLNLIAIESK